MKQVTEISFINYVSDVLSVIKVEVELRPGRLS